MKNIEDIINNQKFYFDLEKMENSPLRQQIKAREKDLYNEYAHIDNNISIKPEIKNSLNHGFEPIDKKEFYRIASQLNLWNIKKAGAVIKREGPTFVRLTVDITLQNIDRAKSPKSYFRGVLKNLQKKIM
jgi:hypothetical protein